MEAGPSSEQAGPSSDSVVDQPPSSWLTPLRRTTSPSDIRKTIRRIESLASQDGNPHLRDPFERDAILSWLNRLTTSISQDQDLIDSAAHLLERLVNAQLGNDGSTSTPHDASIERTFVFPFDYTRPNALYSSQNDLPDDSIAVTLVDEELPPSTTDDTSKEKALAVGVQTWAAAIVLSDLIVTRGSEIHKSLVKGAPETGRPTSVLELGAGTGLVGLVCARVLQKLAKATGQDPGCVTLTDYHPLVLANLERNVQTNLADKAASQEILVYTRLLDWSEYHDGSKTAADGDKYDLILAADVVYSPDHAKWLYSTVAALLAVDNQSRAHILNAKRTQGRFGEWDLISLTDEAFGRRSRSRCGQWTLKVLKRVELAKRNGLGRSDESGHVWWTLGWTCEEEQEHDVEKP